MGEVNDSWILIVGKSMGRPPEERLPRLRDSISWGTLAWQGLKAEKVLVMPIMGFDTGEDQIVSEDDSLDGFWMSGEDSMSLGTQRWYEVVREGSS